MCPDRDSSDLSLFDLLTAQFRRNLLRSIAADDRTRGNGFETQKREGGPVG